MKLKWWLAYLFEHLVHYNLCLDLYFHKRNNRIREAAFVSSELGLVEGRIVHLELNSRV